jgi:hypothetical protein
MTAIPPEITLMLNPILKINIHEFKLFWECLHQVMMIRILVYDRVVPGFRYSLMYKLAWTWFQVYIFYH